MAPKPHTHLALEWQIGQRLKSSQFNWQQIQRIKSLLAQISHNLQGGTSANELFRTVVTFPLMMNDDLTYLSRESIHNQLRVLKEKWPRSEFKYSLLTFNVDPEHLDVPITNRLLKSETQIHELTSKAQLINLSNNEMKITNLLTLPSQSHLSRQNWGKSASTQEQRAQTECSPTSLLKCQDQSLTQHLDSRTLNLFERKTSLQNFIESTWKDFGKSAKMILH